MFVCGATRGHWSKPVPLTQVPLKWVNAKGRRIKCPKKLQCERCSDIYEKPRYFNSQEMFVQKWIMTKKELKDAVKDFDIFSLEMLSKTRILCPECAKKQLKTKTQNNKKIE